MALKRQLAQASPATLAMVRAEIAACVATASNVAQQAQASASSGTGMAGGLATAAKAAREAVSDFADDYYGKRKFDPYLTFASDEEEREFRKREAQREKEIEAARAEGTPEGDKRAAGLSLAQLEDAGAHGADRSPDYELLRTKLATSNAGLEAQLEAGKPTPTLSVEMAADPLDAPAPPADVPPDLLAKFRAAGVVVADQRGTGHGVNEDVTPQERSARVPS